MAVPAFDCGEPVADHFRHGDVCGNDSFGADRNRSGPKRLELEITEGVLIEDFIRGNLDPAALKTLGVHIAMDDFGTGYSSLSYLQSFPFDKIKIDQAFVGKLEQNPTIGSYHSCHSWAGPHLNLPVIAEGVETKEQELDFLAEGGCAEIQGYLIGRPYPIARYCDVVRSCSGSFRVAIAG